MFATVLPRHLDNGYEGRRIGLWLFAFVVLMKSAQSLAIIFAGAKTARDADGIPLDAFSAAASQTVQAIFAQQSLWRLTVCVVCWIVLLRYRRAIPLMFALLAANYVAGEIVFRFVPLPRVGTPPGPAINLVLFALMVAGFAVSVWRRPQQSRSPIHSS